MTTRDQKLAAMHAEDLLKEIGALYDTKGVLSLRKNPHDDLLYFDKLLEEVAFRLKAFGRR